MTVATKYHSRKWRDFDFHLIWQDGQPTLAYVPLLGVVASVSDSIKDYVTNQGRIPEVLESKLEQRLPVARKPLRTEPTAFHFALGFTRDCTLFCDYCHAEADKKIYTDQRLIDTSIDYAFIEAGKRSSRSLSVSFAVGGEPTMNWAEFRRVIGRIRDLEDKQHHGVGRVYISMTTNGYYGMGKRSYIGENLDGLTLSIDGDEDVQNAHRPAKSGKGSYRLVAESVRYFLADKGVSASLRGTVSSYSVQKLDKIIEHYASEFGGGYTVAFEPLVAIGRGEFGAFGPPSDSVFADAFWSARDVGKKYGIDVITSAANPNRLVERYCGAMSAPSFTLCSNGKITACHRDQDAEDYGYGSVDAETGDIHFDDAALVRNIRLTTPRKVCEVCPAKWHCAGDCPDLQRAGYDRCNLNLMLLYRFLKERLPIGRRGQLA